MIADGLMDASQKPMSAKAAAAAAAAAAANTPANNTNLQHDYKSTPVIL